MEQQQKQGWPPLLTAQQCTQDRLCVAQSASHAQHGPILLVTSTGTLGKTNNIRHI